MAIDLCLARRPGIYDGSDLYVLACDMPLVRIGSAADPAKRVRDINSHSPVRVWLAAVFPEMGGVECVVHQCLGVRRRHGEWFEDGPELRAVLAVLHSRIPEFAGAFPSRC